MDHYSLGVPKSRIGKAKSAEFLTGGYDSSEGDNIKVYVRVRPPDKLYESEFGQSLCLEVTSSTSLTLLSKPEPKVYTYDHVSDVNTTQEEVFSVVGKRIIEGCVAGYNGTIFAYGQTGSGKTFTMMGPPDDSDHFAHDRKGVIPRGFEYLFSLIRREQEKHGSRMEFLCRCSFLEIYNEQIFDLLDAASTGLQLREDIKKGVFVKGLREVDITNAKDAHEVLTAGWTNRRVASTSMNRESSRSHAVFTVTIESKEKKEGIANIKVSQLHLVDLAGSERQKDTQTEGLRLKEAANINRSLSALGNVIMALVDLAHGKQRHVHYRDSKLTFILRDSLGGNARTYIIANIHPSAKCFGETLSTLNFARRAKMIKNKAVVNEDVTGNIAQLQMEIRKLKELLAKCSTNPPPECVTHDSSSEESSSVDYDSGTEVARPRPSCSCDGNAKQWKDMMLSAMSEREKTEVEKKELEEKVQKMEELCNRKEKFLLSTKMILKFRENHIAKLEKLQKKDRIEDFEDSKDKEIQLLREEIKCLQEKIEHHPEVARFAMENLDLRAEIKRLKSGDHPVNGDDVTKSHRYTLQLERQLKEYMTSAQSSDLGKSLSSSLQSLEASNSELDRVKLELVQSQSKLDATLQELQQNRQELQQAREELVEQSEKFRKKELELQSELTAARKTNSELKRTLESFHLKSAVERTALNDIHMQTIKTLTSPLKVGSPMKASPWKNGSFRSQRLNELNSTPRSEESDIESHFISEEKPISSTEKKTLFRRDSLNDTDEEEEAEPFFDFQNSSHDAEAQYCEALLEELNKLQDFNCQQLQKLHAAETKSIAINQQKLKLQHEVDALNTRLEEKRALWTARENDLASQITSLTDSLKNEQADKAILQGEVEDLKIILSSTDRKYDAYKRDKNQESLEAGRKIAAVESKLVKLEVDYFNLQTEMDDTLLAKQRAQSELETLQDELGFLQHKNSELESILTSEREKSKNLDNSLKNALEKLDMEMAINAKLMEDNKEQDVLGAMEHSTELRNELMTWVKKCDDQDKKLSTLQLELSEASTEIAHLKRVSASDKEAVNKLLTAVQELRAQLADKESGLGRVTDELEDAKRALEEMTQSYNEKKKKVGKLTESLKAENEKSSKERSAHEAEISKLKAELLGANAQYEELSELLDNCQRELAALQEDKKCKEAALADLQTELEDQANRHAQQKSSLEARLRCHLDSMEKKDLSVMIDTHVHELDELKSQLSHFMKLSEEWEEWRCTANSELDDLRNKLQQKEVEEGYRGELEERLRCVEEELEAEKEQREERETVFNFQMNELKKESQRNFDTCIQVNKQLECVQTEKEQLKIELEKTKASLEIASENLEELNEDLRRTQAHETRMFEEKEDLRSLLSIAKEEKTKLERELAVIESNLQQLEAEHAKLVGHQNLSQKIRYHMNVKRENAVLKEQLAKVRQELATYKERECKISKAGKETPLTTKNTDLDIAGAKLPSKNCEGAVLTSDADEGKENHIA